MKTRPVFESYSEFVNSLYNAINEAEGEQTPFEVIYTNFQKKMDQTSKDAFTAASTVLLFSPEAKEEVDGSSKAETIFTTFTTDLTRYTTRSSREDEDVKMGGMIGELKEFKYDLIINGKVMLTKPVNFQTEFTKSTSLAESDTNIAGGYVSIFDLLTYVNLDNLNRLRIDSNMYPGLSEPAKLGKEKGKFYWDSNEDGTISNTGASLQKVISDDSSGILISGKSSEVLGSLQSDRLKLNSSKDKTIYKTLVLYGIGDYLPLDPANTNYIPDTYIKKELVEVSGTPKTYNVTIDGGTDMFPKGFSTFTKGKDDYIKKTLTDALAPLIGLPTKITILGGASNEGTQATNEKLVDERAAAIAAKYLELYPALKDKIEAKKGDYSKIQTTAQVVGTTEKEKEASYKEYRKVYVTVEGVIKGEPTTIESALEEKTKIPAGSATIKQYVISLPFTSSKIS